MSKKLGLLIFNHLNDVIYVKWNQSFMKYLQSIAVAQGLLPVPLFDTDSWPSESQDSSKRVAFLVNQGYFNPNLIVQVFSPLVTSHHIMGTQFKNPYESIFCEDGTIIVFQQYSNFVFLCIGEYTETFLQRFISISIQMVKLIVGPCVSILKSNRDKNKTLDNLLSAWLDLYMTEQSYLVEAIERLIVSPEISTPLVSILSTLVNSLVKMNDVGSCHAVLFVDNKLLNLYSSKHAEELNEADLLFLNLVVKANTLKSNTSPSINVLAAKGGLSPPATPTEKESEGCSESEEAEEEEGFEIVANLSPSIKQGDHPPPGVVNGYCLMLRTRESPHSPHLFYVYQISKELSLISLIEINRRDVAGQLYEMFSLLNDLKKEEANIKDVAIMNIMDNCLQRAQDCIKQFSPAAYHKVKKYLGRLHSRWEALKKGGFEEWLKSSSSEEELPSRLEAGISAVLEALESTWAQACILSVSPTSLLKGIELASFKAKESLDEFLPSLESKGFKDMAIGSRSVISITKYLEEFPGLVHFIYVDRSVHQLTAPHFWVGEACEEACSETQGAVQRLTAAKIWSLVEFAREHLCLGHTALLWKDKTFSYSYFLWFEDHGGNPLKLPPLDKETLDLPLPGILCGDFYKIFACRAFPDIPPTQIKIFELFCIHLGMTTSPCILEQTRRLAATVWEIAGPTSANPMDLL